MMAIGPLPPIVALIALWYLAYGYRAALGLDRLSRRGSLVIAFVVLQVLVVVISEGTSLGRLFTTRGVGLAWLVVDVVAVIFATRLFRRGPGLRVRVERLWAGVRATSVTERVLAGFALVELGILVAIGFLYALPTNGDSLVYHLARVAHWVQNGSVQHYAVHYAAQNELSPLHEYNMAHLHVLAGTDRLDGFVQLLAVVICVAGASEIARLLGASRRAQVFAAAFTATIPSLILEATSTQNNDFAAATAVGALVAVFAWRPAGRFYVGAALIGAAVGVAALTKGTLAIVIAITGVVLVVASIVEHVRSVGGLVVARRVALTGVIVIAVAGVVLGPFLSRNVEVYDGLTGPTSRTTLSYELTPAAATANVIRSIASNFQIGNGSDLETWLSRPVLGGLHKLYQPLGVDPADWRYMVGTDSDAFGVADYSGWQRSEAIGANPWHVVLIIVALVMLTVLVLRGERKLRVPLLLGLALAASFLLFVAITRWSPYTVRYQVPLMVIWCPLIALLVDRARRAILGTVLAIGLFLLATPMLLNNASRSLLHPTWNMGSGIEPFFRAWDPPNASLAPVAAGQQSVADVIAGTPCTSVGLANWVMYEYPVWIALQNAGWHGRIDNVNVQDASKVLADPTVHPCALIRQVEPSYVTADPDMVSFRFGPMALSLPLSIVDEKVQDQAGFHSDVTGARVRPGTGWVLGGETPAVNGSARIYLISDKARTVRLRITGATGDIAGWQRTAGELTMTMTLTSGITTLDLPMTPGKASPIGTLSMVLPN